MSYLKSFYHIREEYLRIKDSTYNEHYFDSMSALDKQLETLIHNITKQINRLNKSLIDNISHLEVRKKLAISYANKNDWNKAEKVISECMQQTNIISMCNNKVIQMESDLAIAKNLQNEIKQLLDKYS